MKLLAAVLLALAATAAHANPFIVANDDPPGPAQAKFCAVDANGLKVACVMQPSVIAGNLHVQADLAVLPPGTYTIIVSVSTINTPDCALLGANTWSCSQPGGTATAAPITVTIKPRTGAPAIPTGVSAQMF